MTSDKTPYYRQWYQEHKEERKRYHADWYQRNKERVMKQQASYRHARNQQMHDAIKEYLESVEVAA